MNNKSNFRRGSVELLILHLLSQMYTLSSLVLAVIKKRSRKLSTD